MTTETQQASEKAKALAKAYGDTSFECGEHNSEDDDGYFMVAQRCDVAMFALLAYVARLEGALHQVVKAEGPYSRDPMRFAENVIESQQKIAREALADGDDPTI